MNELVSEIARLSREAWSASGEANDLIMTLRSEGDTEAYVEAVEGVLEAVIDAFDVGEASIYHRYSGRGMYGKQCYGISTDEPATIIEIAGAHGLYGAKTDSLGHNTIVYWPSLVSASEDAEEDDE